MTESKASSTTETAIEPSDAPVAIDSPRAQQAKQDLRNARHSQAVVIFEKLGPWLIIMAFTLGVTICALAMIFYFGPTYIEAKIDKAVAESESRTRQEVAQAEVRIRTETAHGTADAKATAHVARTQALVAVDKVEDLRVKLAPNVVLDGH